MGLLSKMFSAWHVVIVAMLFTIPIANASDSTVGASQFDAKDRQAVINLIASYGPLYDSAQLAHWRSIFVEEPVFELWLGNRKLVDGIDLFLPMARKRHEKFKEQKMQRRHFLTPRITNQGENSISGDAYLLLFSNAGGVPTVVATGVYEFTAVKQGGVWRIKRWVGRIDNAFS